MLVLLSSVQEELFENVLGKFRVSCKVTLLVDQWLLDPVVTGLESEGTLNCFLLDQLVDGDSTSYDV